MPNDETTQDKTSDETESHGPRYTSAYGIGDRAFRSGTHDFTPKPRPGDLHLDRSVPAERQYLLRDPRQPLDEKDNERGDRVIRVSHVFTKDGEWQNVDNGHVGVVLQVPTYGSESLSLAAYLAIERALITTPAGRYLSDEGRRPMVRAVMSALGVPQGNDDPTWDRLGVIDVTGLENVRAAIKELLEYAPDGYLPELGDMGAEYDQVGFAENADEYVKLLNGETNGFGTAVELERGERRKAAPLLSQAVYYAILASKDDGRAVNALIARLREAAGMQRDD